MTKKSRYFLAGSAGVLLVGLGAGTLAYMAFHRAPVVPAGLPTELRFVPADAQMVAYADVRSVMASDMRRELERMTTGRRGQQQMHEFAGIDLAKDVNHVVAFVQPDADTGPATADTSSQAPRALLLAQGQFQQARIEQFIKDHGGTIEDYHGKHMAIRLVESRLPDDAPAPRHIPGEMAIGFVQPDLIAVGPTALVRAAMDAMASSPNVTANVDLMAVIRDESSANAWVVGRYDAVSRRMGLPPAVRTQVPPLRLVSASARIDGGVKATIKAHTADPAAADQLRDVVRGAVSFARLQAASRPELADALKTLELGGTGTTVQLSFMMTPATLRALHPQPAPTDAPADSPAQPKP
jgi:hypothetical protein